MQLYIKKADNQLYVYLGSHVSDDPMDHNLIDKQAAAAGSAYPIADKCVAGGSEHR